MTNQYETPEAESLSSAMHAATSAFQPPTAASCAAVWRAARSSSRSAACRWRVRRSRSSRRRASARPCSPRAAAATRRRRSRRSPAAVTRRLQQQRRSRPSSPRRAALDALKQLLPTGYTVSDVKLRDADTGARGDTSVSVEALVDPGDGKATTLYLAPRPGATAGDNACWTFTAGHRHLVQEREPADRHAAPRAEPRVPGVGEHRRRQGRHQRPWRQGVECEPVPHRRCGHLREHHQRRGRRAGKEVLHRPAADDRPAQGDRHRAGAEHPGRAGQHGLGPDAEDRRPSADEGPAADDEGGFGRRGRERRDRQERLIAWLPDHLVA
ncbi:hypothetical protein ACU686_22430 [Yinghuangia aomiensis]